MLNYGKLRKDDGMTVINVGKNRIYIEPTSILTALISVRNSNGKTLWQKTNCTASDISFAVEIAKREIETNIFETG